MSEFHGWGVAEPRSWALHIGELPGRKSYCLYEADGSTLRVLAFFKSEATARRALWAIDRIAFPQTTPYEPFQPQ